ncbi:MAG TPA: type II secretion system protein [Anaerohalosphaeraceae bacterium]|nr:type II secretion system protein [Anaerohalosphaeraceae bacterium]
MQDRRGLTLVEVLVTAAVTAVLLALTVPMLKSGRDSGRAVVCISNLKQISLITELYAQDHGSFPQGFCCLTPCSLSAPAGGFAGNQLYDLPGWWWFDFLGIEDRSSGGVLWCPSRRPMNSPLGEDILWCNYGINYSIAKWASETASGEFLGRPLSKGQIRRPSEMLVYSDSGYGLISWKAAAGMEHPFDNNPMRDDSFYLPGLTVNHARPIHPQQQADALAGRHRGGTVSVAYADGQVASRKAERFWVRADEKGVLFPLYFWTAGR